MELSKKIPNKSGLYWCRWYSTKHKEKRVTTAIVNYFTATQSLADIQGFGMVTNSTIDQEENKKYKIMFGDEIEVPDLWARRKA